MIRNAGAGALLWPWQCLIAMAIYHLHVKVIGRKAGSSAVASAAYRSASRMRDERIDRVQDFSNKRGVVHSEVLLSENAPEAWSDRERLWNDVEAFEVRKDAHLAREVEFAIPREITQAQDIEWDFAEDGSSKPHAHVMLTMRSVDENGFGQKVRDWNRTEMVERSHAAEAGAKVVLVGDPQQLQSIEAGAAFRSIHKRHGGGEIGEVRRQREDWQRDATRDLATSRTGAAI